MAYEAKILADSISPAGHRLTTFASRFPRIVLAEVNTHKMLSKSSASSRAIPVEKKIAAMEADMFIPGSFGKNKSGMQHSEELAGEEAHRARAIWRAAGFQMVTEARALARLEVHKQHANRLLEPFSWHTAIISGTDWSNFFHLRVHPAAQGEFREIASMMLDLYNSNAPRQLAENEWHLPLVDPADEIARGNTPFGDTTLYDWAKVSAARCGRVSFERHDRRDFNADIARADEFVKDGHMAPLEHTARAMAPWELDACEQFEALFLVEGSGPRTMRVTAEFLDAVNSRKVEHVRLLDSPRVVNYCGNFNGWVQLRKHIPNEADILASRDDR